MIGPVSTTGRAMMASLQQAIDKGMPPDQAIQYVKSMAQQGVAPLTDLYSMMSQFERLKQKQVKPPQTPPTIKDQLNIMDQMQSQQPPAQPGNIQQMQAASPAPSPMDRGLGAIDAGRMEYPQFNGGGIVAFQEGGPTGQFYGGFYPGMFDGPDRQQRMFGYSEPSPVQDYVSIGRELRKDPYLLKDLKEDPDSVPMTLPTITNPNSGLRAPEGGAYGGGGGGELPYGGPTSYGQNSLQNYLDQFYMDQMMQGGKQYAGGIYDMEGNKIGKAAGGVIGYANRGLVEDIDFTKMSAEQLDMLISGSDVQLARAALRERLRKSGYATPTQLASRYVEAVKAGIPQGGAITYDPRPLPSYMYDAQGNVVTPSTGAGVTASLTEGIVPVRSAPVITPSNETPSTRGRYRPATPTEIDMAAESGLSATSPFAAPEDQTRAVFDLLSSRGPSVVSESAPAVGREGAVTGRREAKREPEKDRYAEARLDKPDLAKITAERIESEKREKRGAFSQADAELAAYIKEQKEQYGASEKEARNNFWIQTGAALMANKSPYFLQALGESVKENYGGLVKDLKRLKDDTSALRLQEIQLRRAQEQAAESGAKEDQRRYETLSQRYNDRQYDILKTEVGIQEKALDRQTMLAAANVRASGNERAADRLMAEWDAAMAEPDLAKRQQMFDRHNQRLSAYSNIMRSTTAGGVQTQSREDLAVANAVIKRREQSDYRTQKRIFDNPGSTEEQKQTARIKMLNMEQEEAAKVSQLLGVSAPGARAMPSLGGYNPEDFSATLISP